MSTSFLCALNHVDINIGVGYLSTIFFINTKLRTHLLLWKRIKVIVRHTKRHLWQNGEKLGEKKPPKNKQLSQYWRLFVT